MVDIITAAKKLLTIAQPGPGANYTWVVEALFADAESPGGGMYTQMGVFDDPNKAQEFAIHLTKEIPVVDFLTFRARPMRPFRPFFDDARTVLLTDDVQVNEAILRADATRLKHEEKDQQRKAALKLQEEAEVKAGTPAHLARLVHLCSQNQSQANFHRKEVAAAETSYTNRLTELKATLAANPNVDWIGYITPILTRINEMATLAQLLTWWEKNKVEVQLPLPLVDPIVPTES